MTAPLRSVSLAIRRTFGTLRHVFRLFLRLGTIQLSKTANALLPYYGRYVRTHIHDKLPSGFVRFVSVHLLHPERKRGVARDREAESFLKGGKLSGALSVWNKILIDFRYDEYLSGRAKLGMSIADRLSDIAGYRDQISRYNQLRKGRREERKIAVFSAIMGDYDSLNLPCRIDPRLDYILFTDRPVVNTDVWEVRPATYLNADATRSARYVKTHPHMLLSEYDIAIWVDANITILGDIYPMVMDFASDTKAAVGAFPHPLRNSFYEEFSACLDNAKDDKSIIINQEKRYKLEEFSYSRLSETGFVVFNLRNPKVSTFLNLWWREIDRHSRRDQLSFGYALSSTGLDWTPLARHYHIRNHPKLTFVSHKDGKDLNSHLLRELRLEKVNPYGGASYSQVRQRRINEILDRKIDVVVCVHNAIDDVRLCLESVVRMRLSRHQALIIVDDGSNEATAQYLKDFSAITPGCALYRNEVAGGYPKAANQGLAASTGEFVILLNSDTVVTNGWAEKLADAVISTPGAGVVGPLSNAASYQSVPEYRCFCVTRNQRC